jgi:hypothetical protein
MFDPDVIAGFRKLEPGVELTLSKRLRQRWKKCSRPCRSPNGWAIWDTPERKREYALREQVYKAIAGAAG